MKQEDRRLLKPSFLIAAVLVAVLLLSTLVVTERGNCGENITWKLRANGRLTVQGAGPIPDYDAKEDISPFYNRSVVMADLQEGISVIGANAFNGCLNMRRVVIPQSVTVIGAKAFSGCTKLATLDIDKDNNAFTFENGTLFTADGAALLFRSQQAGGKEYTVPQGVTAIAEEAFFGNKKLTRIDLPESLTEIGEGAFRGCTKLETITVPEKLDLSFTDGVLYGKDDTVLLFCAPAAGKENFTAPSGVRAIGASAFSGCKTLTSVTLPALLTSVGENAFRGCTKLTDVYFQGTEEAWNAVAGSAEAFAALEDVTVHFQ